MNYFIMISQSGLVFQIAILTAFRISVNSDGCMSEIGKYPFERILITLVYMHSCVKNSSYNLIYFSHNVLKYRNELMA